VSEARVRFSGGATCAAGFSGGAQHRGFPRSATSRRFPHPPETFSPQIGPPRPSASVVLHPWQKIFATFFWDTLSLSAKPSEAGNFEISQSTGFFFAGDLPKRVSRDFARSRRNHFSIDMRHSISL